jgi:nucleoside-diphosphate-sugar epimerase
VLRSGGCNPGLNMVDEALRTFPQLSKQSVLVTGADGFIGARVVRCLLQSNANVAALCHSNHPLKRLKPNNKLRLYNADVTSLSSLEECLEQAFPTYIVHCAGMVDWRQNYALSPDMMLVHGVGVANILTCAKKQGVKGVVILGSAGEYGTAPSPCREDGPTIPQDPYSVAKLSAMHLADLFGRIFSLPCVVVRPFNVYGPGEPTGRLVPVLLQRAKFGGGDVPLTLGEQRRDFVYVDDVAEGIVRALLEPKAQGTILNLCTGVPRMVREVVTAAVNVTGGILHPQFGALPYREGEVMELWGSTSRLEQILGWKPTTSIEDGLLLSWKALQEEQS